MHNTLNISIHVQQQQCVAADLNPNSSPEGLTKVGVTELFRYLLRTRRYKRKSVEVGIFEGVMGHLERKFQMEGSVAHQALLVSEN